jgi:hypothetical protein
MAPTTGVVGAIFLSSRSLHGAANNAAPYAINFTDRPFPASMSDMSCRYEPGRISCCYSCQRHQLGQT